ncbi:MAG: hypothetical protein K6T85_00765 [Gorillibacterium sp.]|nr:hypothetical protein [Gorillibacterium sp.]
MGIYNCDWLSFTADFEGYNGAFLDSGGKRETFDVELNLPLHSLFGRLDEQRAKQDGSGMIDLGMWKFEVLNHGSRSYYYLLHNEDMEIRLARFRSSKDDMFPVFLHLKSQFLWSSIYGMTRLIDKYKLVMDWLQDVLNGKYLTSKINRIDLCYHTDDIPYGFCADRFVGRFTVDDTRRAHRIITGVNLGSRRSQQLYLRCYNKSLEARATKKSWFKAIWLAAGLDIKKVWNIEFQVDREFFSDFKAGRQRLDTAEDVIDRMPTIWYYLTNEWATYRIPDDDRRTRWTIDPWWSGLASFYECNEHLSRFKQRTLPTVDLLIPAIRGYLSSYAARLGGDLEDGSLLADLVAKMKEYELTADKTFLEVVERKMALIDPESEIDTLSFLRGETAKWMAQMDAEDLAKVYRPEPKPEERPKEPEQITTVDIFRKLYDEANEKRDAGTSPSSELYR